MTCCPPQITRVNWKKSGKEGIEFPAGGEAGRVCSLGGGSQVKPAALQGHGQQRWKGEGGKAAISNKKEHTNITRLRGFHNNTPEGQKRVLRSPTGLVGLRIWFLHLEITQTLEFPDLSLNPFSGTSHCMTGGGGRSSNEPLWALFSSFYKMHA